MSEKRKLNRRGFLKIEAGAAGVATLSCVGLTAIALDSPKIEYFERSYLGETQMEKCILVAYASRAGSTGEVAQAIGEELNSNGNSVDVMLIKDVKDLKQYQAVVLGSAIRIGSWLPEAKKFLEKNKATLTQVPMAYFTVCMTLHEDTPENREEVKTFLDPVRAIMEPIDEGYFAGVADFSKLSFLERKMGEWAGMSEGDYRNWDAIRTWAQSLPDKIL